jgi:hypothetical protein
VHESRRSRRAPPDRCTKQRRLPAKQAERPHSREMTVTSEPSAVARLPPASCAGVSARSPCAARLLRRSRGRPRLNQRSLRRSRGRSRSLRRSRGRLEYMFLAAMFSRNRPSRGFPFLLLVQESRRGRRAPRGCSVVRVAVRSEYFSSDRPSRGFPSLPVVRGRHAPRGCIYVVAAIGRREASSCVL